jgi:hypothetical protein
MLSGCGAVGGVAEALIWIPSSGSPETQSTHNYYEPEVLISSPNMIRIQYLGTGPHTRHEEVIQMMSDHCDDSYVETYRVHEIGYTTVEAECTNGSDP